MSGANVGFGGARTSAAGHGSEHAAAEKRVARHPSPSAIVIESARKGRLYYYDGKSVHEPRRVR